MFTVVNHRLHFNGLPVEYHASPNFDRNRRIDPRLLVIHDTAGHGNGNGTIAHFMNAATEASCHIMIREDGRIVQFVDFDRRAWHCGISEWMGESDCNSWALGIEMCNPGKLWGSPSGAYPENYRHKFTASADGIVQIDTKMHGKPGGYWKPYTTAQIETLIVVTAAIAEAYPKIDEVVGHAQISPGRKVDPNPVMFNEHWPKLEAALRPAEKASASARRSTVEPARTLAANDAPLTRDDVKQWQGRLNALGFGPIVVDGLVGTKTKAAIWAFQTENALSATGELDVVTIEKLRNDAKPAAIAGRQSFTEKDLATVDPNIANARAQGKLGQMQVAIAGIVAFLSIVAELGRAISSIVVSWGGDLVLLIGCGLLAGFGLFQWRTSKRFIKRALGEWVNGTSGSTEVPAVPSKQEG